MSSSSSFLRVGIGCRPGSFDQAASIPLSDATQGACHSRLIIMYLLNTKVKTSFFAEPEEVGSGRNVGKKYPLWGSIWSQNIHSAV